jgi:hypothetical protein
VERYVDGDYGWLTAWYYFDVAGRATVEGLLAGGGVAVDTRGQSDFDAGHLPDAEHAPAAGILTDPAAFLAGRDPLKPLILYGAERPDATLRKAAAAVEGTVDGPRVYLYTGGYADWQGGN